MRNDQLRLARIHKHLTEAEVCCAIGADVRTYQHWERGKHTPQPYYRKKLCAFFGLSLQELGFDPLLLLSPRRDGVSSTPAPPVTDAMCDQHVLTIPTDPLEIALLALSIGQQERGWSQRQIQEYVMSQMSHQNQPGTISRRAFGLLLAGLPLAALALTEMPEELFPYCSANLTTAWKLAKGSDLPLAQSIVQVYLPALRPLAEHPSGYQQEAAELVAMLYMLNGLIEMHLVHLQAREQSCQQAVKYAEISKNIELMVAARRMLGSTYYFFNNPTQAVKEFQYAAGYLNQVTPLLGSLVLTSQAIGFAQLQQRQEALASLNQGQEIFFGKASEAQDNPYIGFDAGVLILNTAQTYYALGDYQKSLETLLQIDGFQPKQLISERVRLQLLIHQTLAVAKLNDLEQATTYLEAAATGAVELGSKQRFSEARKTYHALEFLWPNETKVAALGPLFQKRLT